MTDAHRLPASREAVENNAAANARPNPTSASKNFSHTSTEAECSHCRTRLRPARVGVESKSGKDGIHLLGA